MIPVQRRVADGNADDTMAELERLAAADALFGQVSHMQDPDGPCSRGWTHDGDCHPEA